jgi:drug/metabolite transporter (DMT)-like permease
MKKEMDPYVMSFQQFAVTGVLSYITALMFGIDLKYDNADMGIIILFLALFPTVSGFLIQMAAQRFTSSIKVAAIFSLEPVFAAIFAWTIGGERFSVNGAVGGFLIVAAMIMAELPIGKVNAEPVPAKPHGEI